MFPFSRVSHAAARRLASVFFFCTLGLGMSLVGVWLYIHRLTLTLPLPENPKPVVYAPPASEKISPLLVQYRLDVPGRGEVFPALASASAADYWPLAIVSVSNSSSRAVGQVITAEVLGWSRVFQHSVVVGPHASVGVRIAPELLPDAYGNQEIQHAMLNVSITDESGAKRFAQSQPVLIHSGSDLYWGKQFANAQVVARWVTPHDPAVLQLVSESHAFIANGRMPGYNASVRNSASPSQASVAQQVTRQAEAVFKAIQRSGFSYVSSIFTFGGFTDAAQRIRLPRETLNLDSANCMDISVAFASAMENLDMEPVIVIVPGHAFTGVRLGPQSQEILYLDLTVLPKGKFQQAVARAQQWMKKTPAEQVLTVDVASARRMGIYPLPGPVPPATTTRVTARIIP